VRSEGKRVAVVEAPAPAPVEGGHVMVDSAVVSIAAPGAAGPGLL